jgi:methyl-accepting chemotaxis protein
MNSTKSVSLNPSQNTQNETRLAIWCLLPMTPLAPLSAMLVGNTAFGLGFVSVLAMAVALVVVAGLPRFGKAVLAAALLLQTMLFTAALDGHPWQIDTHMLYFAVLAVIAVMDDFKVLIGAAAFVAVHHLGMSLTMPTMLYPEMTEGYVARTLLHAAVVGMETVFLGRSILQRQAVDLVMSEQRDILEQTSADNKKAEEMALFARRVATDAMAVLDQHLCHLAAQDFSRTIDTPLPADYDQIRLTFNSLVQHLRRVLKTSAETSLDYRAGSTELAGAAEDLAQRTEVQAGALSQIAESLQGLTVQLTQSATGAKQVEEIAIRTQGNATANGEIVQNAVMAMQRIEESSGEISIIITMIEDIAFQTNLLALNAGVEAARAGDSGRGFAVVASEVRALAKRTSDAAQSVKQLIVRSSQQVENGSNLVRSAGDALAEIVVQVSQTSTMVGEMSASVSGQARIVKDLNDAIQTLDKATRHNAALCEEMTAMGDKLSGRSAVLSDALSGFRFDGAITPLRKAG